MNSFDVYDILIMTFGLATPLNCNFLVRNCKVVIATLVTFGFLA
jgi:hypothetical protein